MYKKLYAILPIYIQNLVFSVYGYINDFRRYPTKYYEVEREVLRGNNKNREEIISLQKIKLSEQLKSAVKSTFWSNRFKKYNVDINGDPFFELNKLPILTKKEVRDNVENILIKDSTSVVGISTSGTTGAGLSFYESRESEWYRWATWWRYRFDYGVNKRTWCAIFSGRSFVFNSKPPFYRINFSARQYYFCAYNISLDNIDSYIEALNSKKAPWIHGYPSLLSQISSLALKKKLKLLYKPKVVSIGSESLQPWQAKVINEFFRVEPIQHYGLAESVANFSQRKDEKCLTVDEDFSYVEFINDSIVGTNFNNPVFPLFRYQTGDLAVNVDESTFPRKLGSVEGRSDDVIVLANGIRIGRVGHVFKNFSSIDQVQIYQPNYETLIVRLLKNARWKEVHEVELRRALNDLFSGRVSILIEDETNICRTKSGKVKFVISEVH
ncbi:hypothetical protein [Vibrio sp. E14]|uniref:hypothetical protein n=1 Tax=Vibrio sp. E14 TaxID=2849869 RepID=UPI001CF86A45|nr:hypothetical protein [Vibrio sp. E14]